MVSIDERFWHLRGGMHETLKEAGTLITDLRLIGSD